MTPELPHYFGTSQLLKAQKLQKKRQLMKEDARDLREFLSSFFPAEPGKLMKLIKDDYQVNNNWWIVRNWYKDRKQYAYRVLNSQRYDKYRREKAMNQATKVKATKGGLQSIPVSQVEI